MAQGQARSGVFPIEIFEEIFAHLDQASLFNCMCCCRTWAELCRPTLYTNVVLREGKGSDFARQIEARPFLASYVRRLSFIYSEPGSDVDAADILPLVSGLQHLLVDAVEGPASDEREGDPDYQDRFMPSEETESVSHTFVRAASGEPGVLPSLETCFLRYKPDPNFPDDDKWDLDHKAALFLYPPLKSLVVHDAIHDQAAYFEEDFASIPDQRGATSLENLEFYHCRVVFALGNLMRMPHGLKRFKLVEGPYSHYPDRRRFPTDRYMRALDHQRHSLESIHWENGGDGREGARLGEYHQLKTLSIDLDILFGNGFRSRMNLASPHHDPQWPGLGTFLPSSLENLTLRFIGQENHALDQGLKAFFLHMAAQKPTQIPRLRHLTLSEAQLYWDQPESSRRVVLKFDFEEAFAAVGVDVEQRVIEVSRTGPQPDDLEMDQMTDFEW